MSGSRVASQNVIPVGFRVASVAIVEVLVDLINSTDMVTIVAIGVGHTVAGIKRRGVSQWSINRKSVHSISQQCVRSYRLFAHIRTLLFVSEGIMSETTGKFVCQICGSEEI